MSNSVDQREESRSTLVDDVYEKLLQKIISGELRPGEIVSEVNLARQLDVSRTPVHDALRQLASEGLIDQRPGRRAVIAVFSQDDIHDIFEMRKLLEGEATRRAATRLDRQSLTRLRALAEELAADRDGPEWVARWTDFDEEFHETIAKASGSKRLSADISRYRLLHRGFNLSTTTVECLQQAMQEHINILEALEKRDPQAASSAMLAHIQEWQAYFVNHLPQPESR